MRYSNILKLLQNNNINFVDSETTSCVASACFLTPLSDEEFDMLCDFTRYCFDDSELDCMQSFANVVCDMYQNLEYGFYNPEKVSTFEGIRISHVLTKENMDSNNPHRYLFKKMVIEVVGDSY